jgi:threonine dehydrogenase-like Zn-dependent dehydrogenase
MGHETAGRIVAVGNKVDRFLVGESVTFNPLIIPYSDRKEFEGREQHSPRRRVIGVDPKISAAFAEFVVVPQENVVSLGDLIPVELGALIEPLAVALHAARRTGLQANHNLLVVGGGPIGQSAVLAARAIGVERVIVSEVIPHRRLLCESLGAEAIDPRATDLRVGVERIWGHRADVTLDAVGNSQTLADAASATRMGGVIGLVGMDSPSIEIDAYLISTEERALVGSFCYSHQDFLDAANWASANVSVLHKLVSEYVKLADAPDAFRRLASSDSKIPGKILVRFEGVG